MNDNPGTCLIDYTPIWMPIRRAPKNKSILALDKYGCVHKVIWIDDKGYIETIRGIKYEVKDIIYWTEAPTEALELFCQIKENNETFVIDKEMRSDINNLLKKLEFENFRMIKYNKNYSIMDCAEMYFKIKIKYPIFEPWMCDFMAFLEKAIENGGFNTR